MIYTLEKRHEFGYGTMTTHYEVRSYSHRSSIGALVNGKTLKKGTKSQCEKYCRTKNINYSIEN
jgi:hypothetical protein